MESINLNENTSLFKSNLDTFGLSFSQGNSNSLPDDEDPLLDVHVPEFLEVHVRFNKQSVTLNYVEDKFDDIVTILNNDLLFAKTGF